MEVGYCLGLSLEAKAPYDKLILELEKENTELLEKVEQLKAERDAAVEDMRMLGRMGRDICVLCEHYSHGEGSSACSECVTKGDRFAWNGYNRR